MFSSPSISLWAFSLATLVAGCEGFTRGVSDERSTSVSSAPTALAETQGAVFAPPGDDAIPSGPLGDSIKRGRDYLTKTKEKLPQHVGNGLHCTSCHLNGGKTPHAAPWVGIVGVFPELRARNGKVNVLQERVNDCFERSMNGKALPQNSAEMNDIIAYMTFLSKGVPVGQSVTGRGFDRINPAPQANQEHGKAVYAARCAACHGDDGAGKKLPDGGYLFPALWGPESFNIGAGMARLHTAAAFVKTSMPLGAGNTLTAQEAYDVAAFFTTQPRPDFKRKAEDWPQGGKPEDARY